MFIGALIAIVISDRSIIPTQSLHSTSSKSRLIGKQSQTRPLASTTVIYLPTVFRSPTFSENSPIWPHDNEPAPHEVAFFRYTFTLSEPLTNAELYIFADTRYEAWIDGVWIGRGPARFSHTTREYDVYALETLAPGSHLISVLVQWAPNLGRSESSTPYLQAHVQGKQNDVEIIATRTGSIWRAILSNAWAQDSELVQAWGLIGPSELLDLTKLPKSWMLPSFFDDEWPSAVVKSSTTRVDYPQRFISLLDPTHREAPYTVRENQFFASQNIPPGISYQQRSIPPLEQVLVETNVIDAGLLSPGRAISELVPPVSSPYTLTFTAQNDTPYTIEIISTSGYPPTNTVLLDSNPLFWNKAQKLRPDVYVVTTTLSYGAHELSFQDIPPKGITFATSTSNIQPQLLTFQQGLHAGRRLLLAEPQSQLDKVAISINNGLDVEFDHQPSYLVLDLGRVIQGRLIAQVSGPKGTVVDIGWDERLYMDTRPLPYPGSEHLEWNQVDSWVLDGTMRSIATLDTRAGRYILIAVWGNGPVYMNRIQVYEERYPVTQLGSFSSSDPLLNQIWQIGVDTLYANMSDGYADPWRERRQWWGDAFVDYHTNLVAFGDTKLLRRGLALMAEGFNDGRPVASAPNGNGVHMLDYGMLWVQSVEDYWQLSNDIQLLEDVAPVIKDFIAYLETYRNIDTGLLDIPDGHWSLTTLIDWAGYDSRYGQSTAVNALYYATLLDAAMLAHALGDTDIALSWEQKAALIQQQMTVHLYLPTQHRYISSIHDGESLYPSPHAQAWALTYDLVPDSEVDQVASSLLELLSSDPGSPNVEIYGMFWVLEGLGRAGRIPDAINLIKSYYGRLIDLGATTWWETFNANLHYWAALSHGWGSSPTWFLTSYVLGLQRKGTNTWLLKPALAGVEYVEGKIPLQSGKIQASWENLGCGDQRIELTAPSGTEGELIIPFINKTTTLLLNGTVIWRDRTPLITGVTQLPDGIHIYLQSGNYILSISGFLPECSNTSNLK